MKKVFYEVCETTIDNDMSMLLDNPNHKAFNLRWYQFESEEKAIERMRYVMDERKHQYTYFTNKDDKVVDKISYYDRYQLKYVIRKVEQEITTLYNINNDDRNKREIKKHKSEFINL